jgi:ankyrin repeat protein
LKVFCFRTEGCIRADISLKRLEPVSVLLVFIFKKRKKSKMQRRREFLIYQGTPVEFKMEDGTTPLYMACGAGHYGVVKILLQRVRFRSIGAVVCINVHRARM